MSDQPQSDAAPMTPIRRLGGQSVPDIVERLRMAIENDFDRDDPTYRLTAELLEEAAGTIERQRYLLARWEAAQVIERGSVAEPPADDGPLRIVDAEPNAPR